MSNKVLFGDLKSEWYDHESELKQGCIASPTFFNVLTNELTTNLADSGIGVEVANILINNLLIADDTVLIAGNATDLENILNTTDSFAKRWNLKLNEHK